MDPPRALRRGGPLSRRHSLSRDGQHRPHPGRRKGFLLRRAEGHGDGPHHARRREPGPVLRDHGGAEGDLRPVRRRREDGLPPAESRDDPRPGRAARPFSGLQGEQPRSRAEDPVDQRRQVRPEKGGHPLPLQAQPHPRRDGDEKQPGDDLVRHPRRRQLRRVPAGHGRLFPVPDPLPPVERPHPGREGGVGRRRDEGGDRERRVRRAAGRDRAPAGEELQGDPGRRHVRPPRQGGRSRLRHLGEDGPDDRDPGAGTGPAPEQHRKRSRAGLGQHGERDRLGDGALPARHHHGEGDRRARPDVGKLRGDRKAPVHDVPEGRVRRRDRRLRPGGGAGEVPGGGAEVPDGRQGAVPVRSARRAHHQGVRPRPRRLDPRHGSSPEPAHPGDQRQDQRQPRIQDRPLRRDGRPGAHELRGEGARRRHVR